MRSSAGCWTCRLRRKKCDEKFPVCNVCTTLRITCHFGQEKPEWMDGGAKQQEMAEQLKREVKQNAQLYYVEGPTHIPERPTVPGMRDGQVDLSSGSSSSRLQTQAGFSLTREESSAATPYGRSDPGFVMFFLEHVLPFLFPFYQPSYLLGGRGWVLEMMTVSPVLRLATLCQSSYFFSIARGSDDRGPVWDAVLTQSREAFEMLGQSLLDMGSSDITEHLHEAVTILTSIMQVQRFEITISSFDNCQAHLNAALALFRQLLESPVTVRQMEPESRFDHVICQIGPPAWVAPARCLHVPSAEQSAFRFSSALLILDDIVSSTVRQKQPMLYEYHRHLLASSNGTEPPVNLQAVVGCQNWVLLHISDIAVLDAWKQQHNRAGNLNVMELVSRAKDIKDSLDERIKQHEAGSVITSTQAHGLLPLLSPNYLEQSEHLADQSALVTAVWAHATLIYLSVVVSGWQPAGTDVRYHVGQIVELLVHRISPPALLRTMVWPFCVAGCLAEPAQEAQFRDMVASLQPVGVFGTARKALEIMEDAWCSRDTGDRGMRDLASCFKSRGEFVLLV